MELLRLADAYENALEFDYCTEAYPQYMGLRPDEIVNKIIKEIYRLPECVFDSGEKIAELQQKLDRVLGLDIGEILNQHSYTRTNNHGDFKEKISLKEATISIQQKIQEAVKGE